MKEATGELNMTVVVVIAVGVLAAFFYTTIWPLIRNSYIATSKCNNAVCNPSTLNNGTVDCVYYEDGHQVGESFKCVWKG